jgi:transcriptional regulator with XRE-family HTH domain
MAKPTTEEPHPIDKSVGQRVARRRLELGYSQADLGKALNLTFQQIQKYEKGANRISASKLWEASSFLDVDVSYFFREPNRQEPVSMSAMPTRYSVEINRILPALSIEDQKLILSIAQRLEVRPQSVHE